jgi:serine/threonine-protein kinase
MAPELMAGARGARPASDVFAFGLIAYEVVAGARAFAEPVIFRAMAGKPLADVPKLPAKVDAALAAMILRCLAVEPDARPTAAEIASQLEALKAEARSALNAEVAGPRPSRGVA